MRIVGTIPLVLASGLMAVSAVRAGEGSWISGDWYLTLGATGLVAPNFEGGKKYML
ncbi:MAG: MipA/OmpV family protein, partial [Mesorhizobium sp.]